MLDTSVPADPLQDSYRVVRALEPPETVFSSVLVRTPDDRTVALARADALSGWLGWTADPDGHVLAVQDVAQSTDGLRVELPWCRETVDAFLDRRAAAGSALDAGEAATLAVSVLRAVRELAVGRGRGSPSPTGRWWLTESGRPMFAAVDDEPDDVEATSVRLLGATAAACDDPAVARLLSATADDLTAAVRGGAQTEDAFFALAAPGPLDTGPVAAVPTAAAIPTRSAHRRTEPHPSAGVRGLVAAHVDSGISDLIASTIDRVRLRLPTRARIGPIAAGAAVALTAIVGGLLWPTGDPAPAQTLPSPRASSSPSATPSEGAGAAIPADDPVAIADALFTGVARCTDDECRSTYVEDASLHEVADSMASRERSISLLDDFGDVLALRVDATDAAVPTQRIVIVRSESGWRLRAVYEGG